MYLSVHTGSEQKAGVQEIADALKVPKHFLGKILQTLSKHDIISSIKGPGGGFYLSEENRQVTIDKIIYCLDGPGVFSACVMGLPNCSSANPCPLHIQVFAYRDGLRYQLEHQTVDEFAKRIEREDIRI